MIAHARTIDSPSAGGSVELLKGASEDRRVAEGGWSRGTIRVVHMTHAARPNRFKVLLANEQEDWHRTVRQLLEPQGVQTLSARNGREALQLIESSPVHVAVLDVQMPQLG